ncbi:hypothetical protein [Ralstonia flaminis]|jgi:hypothetical protein|uniref:Phasin domain-containing protein n=1 Tax=Ralstonia flaminis TaxID=3058597 RepID=A0ABM9K979_9RALS|nr:hypothetical protein [Ralstonia sp. LMG 18101]CAJ0818123.1 hypothetical protein LMG18101_03503 [Ralstonia sp. LMG 18101]
MDTPANLPLALFKAQVALGLQTLGLLKTARQRWYELGAELLAEDVGRTESALTELQGVEDWNAWATLLPNAFWQANQRAMNVVQGVMQTAIANQASFATDYQRAMMAWQQASVQALSAAGNAMPVHTVLQGMLSSLGAPADAFIRSAVVLPGTAPARSMGNGQLRTAS